MMNQRGLRWNTLRGGLMMQNASVQQRIKFESNKSINNDHDDRLIDLGRSGMIGEPSKRYFSRGNFKQESMAEMFVNIGTCLTAFYGVDIAQRVFQGNWRKIQLNAARKKPYQNVPLIPPSLIENKEYEKSIEAKLKDARHARDMQLMKRKELIEQHSSYSKFISTSLAYLAMIPSFIFIPLYYLTIYPLNRIVEMLGMRNMVSKPFPGYDKNARFLVMYFTALIMRNDYFKKFVYRNEDQIRIDDLVFYCINICPEDSLARYFLAMELEAAYHNCVLFGFIPFKRFMKDGQSRALYQLDIGILLANEFRKSKKTVLNLSKISKMKKSSQASSQLNFMKPLTSTERNYQAKVLPYYHHERAILNALFIEDNSIMEHRVMAQISNAEAQNPVVKEETNNTNNLKDWTPINSKHGTSDTIRSKVEKAEGRSDKPLIQAHMDFQKCHELMPQNDTFLINMAIFKKLNKDALEKDGLQYDWKGDYQKAINLNKEWKILEETLFKE